jgi:hypothetical protein
MDFGGNRTNLLANQLDDLMSNPNAGVLAHVNVSSFYAFAHSVLSIHVFFFFFFHVFMHHHHVLNVYVDSTQRLDFYHLYIYICTYIGYK